MISVWDTGHGNSTIITPHVYRSILAAGERAVLLKTSDYRGGIMPSVFYGILRGNSPIIKRCAAASSDWWFVDNGYFRPGHYDGYYLVGKNHLQPRFSSSAPVEPKRWEKLGIQVRQWRTSRPDSHVLVCPPTSPIATYYNLDKSKWLTDVVAKISKTAPGRPMRLREKGTTIPLAEDFKNCHCVVTFNSKVAMEAIIQGIPSIADVGLIKDWNGLSAANISDDLTARDRTPLFHFAASCQFRLEEFTKGVAWKMVRRVLS